MTDPDTCHGEPDDAPPTWRDHMLWSSETRLEIAKLKHGIMLISRDLDRVAAKVDRLPSCLFLIVVVLTIELFTILGNLTALYLEAR